MAKKFIFSFCSLYFICILCAFNISKKGNSHLKSIVLDAGHGGKDEGAPCWNNNCNEATITLSITLKLGKELEKLLPDLKIYYTRKDDSYPSLHYRAEFANSKEADLFLSVHCNSADPIYKRVADGTRTVTYYVGKGKKKKKKTREEVVYKSIRYENPVKGLETYLWIPGKNEQKTDAVASRENAEIFKDPDYKTKYGGGLDINSAEFIAKAKLRTKKYFLRSTMLANLVQEEGAYTGRNDRNVKQRGVGIWVLQATAMPSVLVETGYISNPEEAKYLSSEHGQQEMAEIIAKAIKKYHDELDKTGTKDNSGIPIHQGTQKTGLAFQKPGVVKIKKYPC